jgi:hypothetical protein
LDGIQYHVDVKCATNRRKHCLDGIQYHVHVKCARKRSTTSAFAQARQRANTVISKTLSTGLKGISWLKQKTEHRNVLEHYSELHDICKCW